MLLAKLLSFVRSLSRWKTQDTVLTGIIGGLIGTICMDITNAIIFIAKGTESLYAYTSGQLFTSARKTKQKKFFILGELLHLGVGSFLGIPTIYMLKKTGKDHYWVKGFISGILNLGIFYTGGQKIGLFKKPKLARTHYSAFFNNSVYGLASVFAMVKFADPNIFASVEKSKGNNINTEQGITLVPTQNLVQEQPSE